MTASDPTPTGDPNASDPTDQSATAGRVTPDLELLATELVDLLHDQLHVVVDGLEVDLFATGALDSLAFVDLLFQLEQRYGVTVEIDDIEPERFATVRAIAAFVAEHRAP